MGSSSGGSASRSRAPKNARTNSASVPFEVGKLRASSTSRPSTWGTSGIGSGRVAVVDLLAAIVQRRRHVPSCSAPGTPRYGYAGRRDAAAVGRHCEGVVHRPRGIGAAEIERLVGQSSLDLRDVSACQAPEDLGDPRQAVADRCIATVAAIAPGQGTSRVSPARALSNAAGIQQRLARRQSCGNRVAGAVDRSACGLALVGRQPAQRLQRCAVMLPLCRAARRAGLELRSGDAAESIRPAPAWTTIRYRSSGFRSPKQTWEGPALPHVGGFAPRDSLRVGSWLTPPAPFGLFGQGRENPPRRARRCPPAPCGPG